jgi:hypothetical protein
LTAGDREIKLRFRTFRFGKVPVRVGAEAFCNVVLPDSIGSDWGFGFRVNASSLYCNAIANSDAGVRAMTKSAIEQGHRATQEILRGS